MKIASRNKPADAARSIGSSSKNIRAQNSFEKSRSGFKDTEFFLEAPSAKAVQLAADFTDWEKFPLDMVQSHDGVWFAAIPLSPGDYSYRFIVDGQWHDDPRSARRVPNPFGGSNAVKQVT
jgi:1,4-alpha-glucan branching enzyme